MPDFSIITIRGLNADDARAFAGWQYPPPYEGYNLDPGKIENEVKYLLDPKNVCRGMYDRENRFIGICTFGKDGQVPGGDYSEEALDIGMGIHPKFTGQGNGRLFIAAAVNHAERNFSSSLLRVTIAAFNVRAQKVWRNAGFSKGQQFVSTEGMDYLIFTRPT